MYVCFANFCEMYVGYSFIVMQFFFFKKREIFVAKVNYMQIISTSYYLKVINLYTYHMLLFI
jgi:hypothetical protein